LHYWNTKTTIFPHSHHPRCGFLGKLQNFMPIRYPRFFVKMIMQRFAVLAVVALVYDSLLGAVANPIVHSRNPWHNDKHWIDTWATMPQLTEPANLPPAPFVSQFQPTPITPRLTFLLNHRIKQDSSLKTQQSDKQSTSQSEHLKSALASRMHSESLTYP
jgi:hypothetical protein